MCLTLSFLFPLKMEVASCGVHFQSSNSQQPATKGGLHKWKLQTEKDRGSVEFGEDMRRKGYERGRL